MFALDFHMVFIVLRECIHMAIGLSDFNICHVYIFAQISTL